MPGKSCPHCGAALPREASFCPCCAMDLRPRQEVAVPVRRWLKPLRHALVLLALAALMAAAFLLPQVIEDGEAIAAIPVRPALGLNIAVVWRRDVFITREARQFIRLPKEWIQKRMGITGLKTWNELQGIACIDFDDLPPQKQQITTSRSFPQEIYEREALEKIVAEFASMCAEKLRKQQSVCREVRTFIYTNRHRDDQPQRYETGLSLLPEPTSCTPDIVKSARKALIQIYSHGYGYKKAGVILSDITPASEIQRSLFSPVDHDKQARLMEAMDRMNRTFGKGKIVVAAQGTEPFHMNREHLSPRYTTDWEELLVVKA